MKNGKIFTAIGFILLLMSVSTVPAAALELGARAYFWFPDLQTSDVKTVKDGVEGSDINVKDMLGVGNKATFAVEAYGGVGKHHLSFAYTPFGYSDSAVLSSALNFNGVTYAANTGVESELRFSMFDLKYQYDIINLENILAGFSLGPIAQLKFITGDFSITASGPNLDQNRSFNSLLPMIGAGAHIGLIANFLEMRAQVTGGGYGSGNYSIEALADISATPFPFVDINAGYKMVKIAMDVNDYVMDSLFTGPYLALTVGF
ncbi:MAG TPA: hypothetical protein PK114_00600 [Smithellaceae bacterium]|nr:hypothetical protein [Smithellaceae bacterium]